MADHGVAVDPFPLGLDLYYMDGDWLCTIAEAWVATPLRRYNLWQMIERLEQGR